MKGWGMRISRYGHACVRIERGGRTLVIDPGTWSDADALMGADAVLVTHEHGDHFDPSRLTALNIPVFAPEDADLGGFPATRVSAGEKFEAAGMTIEAVGGKHATIWASQEAGANLGFIVEGGFYHPGDALDMPHRQIHTLALPLHASWLPLHAAVDFLNAIDPVQAFGIHDGQLNDRGRRSTAYWIKEFGSSAYESRVDGESFEVPTSSSES